MKKGQYFNDKTYKIVKKLNPNKHVYKNIYLKGKLSKGRREIDVQVVDANSYDFLVIECKDYDKRKIDVPILDGLVGKLKEVNAKKGAIVSNTGYTNTALSYGINAGIDLLNLVDTSDPKIKTKIYAPAVHINTEIDSWQVEIKSSSSYPPLLLSSDVFDNPKSMRLSNGHITVDADILFLNLWNIGELAHSKGSYTYSMEENVFIENINRSKTKLDKLIFHYSVSEDIYMNNIKIINSSGLYDVNQKIYKTNSITTDRIELNSIEKNWKKVDIIPEWTFMTKAVAQYKVPQINIS